MNRKLSRLIEPNLQPYLLCLALFAVLTLAIQPVLAVGEFAVLVILCVYYRKQRAKRRRHVTEYIKSITGGADSISQNSMLNTPLPVVVFQADTGDIIWANNGFVDLVDPRDDAFSMRIGELAPDFDYQWLLDGKTNGDDEVLTEIAGRIYRVYGSLSRSAGRVSTQDAMITAYFIDVTESKHIQDLYDASRPVTCLLVREN